jgi:hypothetical protein
MTSELSPPERRSTRRYDLQTPIRYRTANGPLNSKWKHGSARNMSAGGILVQLPESVSLGCKLELAIDWPGLYHDRENMRLFLIASVARTGPGVAALRIESHRFRDVSLPRVRLRRSDKKLAVA